MVLPQFSHLTMAYCESVRRQRAGCYRATYTTALSNFPSQLVKVPFYGTQSYHRGLGLNDPCLYIEYCNGINNLIKFKLQNLLPH